MRKSRTYLGLVTFLLISSLVLFYACEKTTQTDLVQGDVQVMTVEDLGKKAPPPPSNICDQIVLDEECTMGGLPCTLIVEVTNVNHSNWYGTLGMPNVHNPRFTPHTCGCIDEVGETEMYVDGGQVFFSLIFYYPNLGASAHVKISTVSGQVLVDETLYHPNSVVSFYVNLCG